MDVLHHPNRPQPTTQESSNNTFGGGVAAAVAPHNGKSHKKSSIMSLNGLTLLLFVGIAVILLALAAWAVYGTKYNEGSYVNTSEYQAVFVNIAGTNGGQAYFGHIQTINSKYIYLNDVFYLEPGASTNQFTLNNLSCALYNPSDQMVINRDQVAYWENLKSNSQVTTDIGKWNTDKLTCASTSNTGTTTTPTTGSTTTK